MRTIFTYLTLIVIALTFISGCSRHNQGVVTPVPSSADNSGSTPVDVAASQNIVGRWEVTSGPGTPLYTGTQIEMLGDGSFITKYPGGVVYTGSYSRPDDRHIKFNFEYSLGGSQIFEVHWSDTDLLLDEPMGNEVRVVLTPYSERQVSKETITGSWKADLPDLTEFGGIIATSFTLGEDGTFRAPAQGQWSAGSVLGTYSLDGKRLHISAKINAEDIRIKEITKGSYRQEIDYEIVKLTQSVLHMKYTPNARIPKEIVAIRVNAVR